MSWSVAYNSELAIIEIVLKGAINREDRIAANERAFELADAHRTRRFCLDGTTYERSSALEIVSLVDSYADERFRPERIAVVEPTSRSARKDAAFYETLCANRGWKARVFPRRREAIDWLLADRGSNP